MLIGLSVTIASVITMLAYIQHRATERRFHEQNRSIVEFTVINVELGISTGQISSVKKFLKSLVRYEVFVGAIVYDADSDAIMTIPKGFKLTKSENEIFKARALDDGVTSYQAADLKDPDGELIGRLLIALTFAPMIAEARSAILYTAAFSVFILLPVIGIIAWRLRWYEKALKQNEEDLLEKNQALEQIQVDLEDVKHEIEHMLNNLDQGIFTINPDYTINSQHSLRAQTLFGVSDFKYASITEVFDANDKTLQVFKDWVDLIKKRRFLKNWKKYAKLNPFREIRKQMNGSRRVLKVDYRPIIEDNRLEKVMVLATDITEQIKSQEALEKSQQEQKALMERVLAFVGNEKSAIDAFMEDMKKYLMGFEEIQSYETLSAKVTQLFRETHTIKGNAGTFGFGQLATLASNLEDLLAKIKERSIPELYYHWQSGLEEFALELGKIIILREKLFSHGKDRISISQRAYNKLIQTMDSGEISTIQEVYTKLVDLNSQAFATYCQKYQRIVKVYRERYQKNLADLKIHAPDQVVHRDLMRALDASIVHIIRNAVDHGIESQEEMAGADKACGLISISLESDQAGSTLTITDNGKGIDAEKIANLAVKRKFVSKEEVAKMTEEKKIDFIFAAGFSSKSEVTDISGRGVGMDAVKTNMEKLNGSVSIKTKVDHGTTVVLKMPPMEVGSKQS